MSDPVPEALLTLKQLSLSYRATPVLQGIDWSWQPGEHWAVLGSNGAGKTSLARILSGEQQHFAGQYWRSERLRQGPVAYVCFEQGRRLCERDRKLDCSEYDGRAQDAGTRVRDLLPADVDADPAAGELFALLDMGDILDRGLRFISTGQMRKALLASALLENPALLILDSPLDGLDAASQARLGNMLNTLIPRMPAVLTLCRSPDEVPAACNRLLLLDQGRIRALGETRTMLQNPEVRELLTPPSLEFRPPPQAPAPAAAPAAASILMNGVSVSFGDFCVFRDVSWRFERHHHAQIAGPNGCGKSTLLDLLTGDNHKAYGQDIQLFGRRRGSGESVWDIKAHFGRVDARMQFAVPSGSSVEAVVSSGFYDSVGLRDRPSDRERARAREWLQSLGLSAHSGDEFHTLSFGLQRLVLLARAMVKDPAILLLDEATLGLDPGHRSLLLEAVDHVIAGGRCQLLFVSHTAADRPRCINQLLEFVPGEQGSTLRIQTLPGD